MKIFLTGLPGSGKTTLARSMARIIPSPFIDLDEEIERRQGKTIAEIFSQSGEENFRQKESEMLKKYCRQRGSFVMSVGGGAPCFYDNIHVMNESGVTVFLDVPIEAIVKRLEKSHSADRPLLAGVHLSQRITELRNQRLAIYSLAQYQLTGPSITTDQILKVLKIKKGIQP